MISLKELAEKLNSFNSFAIICHIRPDGDAVGSSLALKKGLEKLGKVADVICDDTVPSKFAKIVDISSYLRKISTKYDAMITVDCAEEGRLGELYDAFSKCKNTFNIDHHVSNTRYAKVNYVVDNPSNCENVYDLLVELGVDIDEDIANTLMLGISTDTGNFAHKGLLKSTFTIAGELIEKGADINKIRYEMFDAKSQQKAKLFGEVFSKIKYDLDGRLAIAVITQELLDKVGADGSDTEGIIDFVLSIDTVLVASSIMEVGKDKYKISLRGKGVNVNAIASVYGGGGHVLASGCMISGNIYEVIEKLTYTVSQHLD